MNVLNNVKVAYKILVLVVVAVIAMLAIGWTGYSHLKNADDMLDNMYSRKLTAIVNLSKARVVSRRMEADTLRAIAENKPEGIQKARAAINEDIKDYEEAWNAYKEAAKFAPEAAAKFPGLDQQWESYKKVTIEIAELGAANKNAEALNLFQNQGERELAGMKQKSDELQKIATDNAEKLHVQSAEDMKSAIESMMLKTLIALLLLAAFSWLSASRISGLFRRTSDASPG